LYSYCSFAILDVKIFELCDKGVKFFFEVFFDRIGFQWDGDGVFIQAEAIGAEQPIGADASVRARDKGYVIFET